MVRRSEKSPPTVVKRTPNSETLLRAKQESNEAMNLDVDKTVETFLRHMSDKRYEGYAKYN